MGITKTDIFTKSQNQIALLAKAIGHPARVAIIEYLLEAKSCICKDVVEELPLAQATVSQHLKALKNAGIIKGNIEGNAICYCLDKDAIMPLKHFLGMIESGLNSELDKCC